MPNGTQVNALGTLNIRGERSVTCRGDFDRHPSRGPLPPDAPPVCEFFRHQPDALERAAELDAAYGRNPDLDGDADVRRRVLVQGSVRHQRTCAPPAAATRPTTSTSRRAITSWSSSCARKGAIIFAKAVNTEYNGRAGDPGGRHKPAKVLPSTLGYQRSTWAGNPANPYDTTRSASLGSSSGSALSVSINLVMASLGEETRASCRGPSNHNAVALILPHKAMLGFDGGAIGADIYCDRSGIHCRTIARLRQGARRAEGSRSKAITIRATRSPRCRAPRCSRTPYASHVATSGARGALERHPARRHPRVDAGPARLADRGADRHRGGAGDQGGSRRASRRDAGRVRRSAVAAPIPTSRR